MRPLLTDLSVDGDGIATLTMVDRAGANALSFDMAAELEVRFTQLQEDERLKVVVLCGTSEHFSTGASRAVLAELAAKRASPRDLLLPRLLLDVPVPVVAAMAGHAVGGGLALALCADVTIAARESRYGATFMRFGFTPGMGTTRLLEYAVGPMLAHEMLLTGRTFRGSRLEGRGAFTYVVPRTEVVARAVAIAQELAEKPRLPLVLLKSALSRRKRELFEAARVDESVMHEATFATPEVTRLIEEMD